MHITTNPSISIRFKDKVEIRQPKLTRFQWSDSPVDRPFINRPGRRLVQRIRRWQRRTHSSRRLVHHVGRDVAAAAATVAVLGRQNVSRRSELFDLTDERFAAVEKFLDAEFSQAIVVCRL